MLSPDELLHISEGGEELAEKLHTEIIRKMVYRAMLRIGRGEDYLLTATDKWQIETLQQAGYLLEDIQKEIAKYTKLQQQEIAEAMEDAGIKALEYDDNIYRDVGLSPVPLTQSPHLIRIMQRNYEATIGEWNNFTRTMALEAQKNFIYQVDKAYNLVSTGAMSYTEAVRDAVNSIISEGATVKYATGHEDTIETATLRAIRTGISQATSQIQMERAKEMGAEKAIVSSHLGARPSHQVWQGKVFTLEELQSTNEGMPALGTVTGLCGVNCRHSWSVWFDGMDNPFEQYDSEENRKQYEKEQRQRTLERRIRDTKRQVIGLKEAVDSAPSEKAKFAADMDYQRKSALLAKQNKAYREYCERNNLKPLSERIQIAKWDRQQAAAARGAAKRYENAHGVRVEKVNKKEKIKKMTEHYKPLDTDEEKIDFISKSTGVSKEVAQRQYKAVARYGGMSFGQIRKAGYEGDFTSEYGQMALDIEEFIKNSPKWDGKIYRGMNLNKFEVEALKQGSIIDMKGISSWSSKYQTAENYTYKQSTEKVIFHADGTNQGTSIMHLAHYTEEEEITISQYAKWLIEKVEMQEGTYHIYVKELDL